MKFAALLPKSQGARRLLAFLSVGYFCCALTAGSLAFQDQSDSFNGTNGHRREILLESAAGQKLSQEQYEAAKIGHELWTGVSVVGGRAVAHVLFSVLALCAAWIFRGFQNDRAAE